MATVATNYDQLRTRIARFLGYSRTSGDWTTEQAADVNDALLDGVRQVLSPPILPGEMHAHRWSFLENLDTVTTTASQSEDTLSGALGIIGPMIYDGQSGYCPVEIIDVQRLLEMRQLSAATGFPYYAAIVPTASTNDAAQEWKIYWYPTPNAEYTIRYQINAELNALGASDTFPLGGTEHARLWQAGCLAAAELLMDDMRGHRWTDFIDALATSVSLDRQLNVPQSLGRMNERERPRSGSRYGSWRHDYITYTSP